MAQRAVARSYSRAIIDELLKPGATIGEAIVRAKKTTTQNRTLVEMYNLLGDPAVVLERPRDDARVAFDTDRWNPAVDVDLGTTRFNGNLVVDWLDANGMKLASTPYALDHAALPSRACLRSPAASRPACASTPLRRRPAAISPAAPIS